MYNEDNEDFMKHILHQQDLRHMKYEAQDSKLIPAAIIWVTLAVFYVPTSLLIIEGFQLAYIYVLFRFGLWVYDLYQVHLFKKEIGTVI